MFSDQFLTVAMLAAVALFCWLFSGGDKRRRTSEARLAGLELRVQALEA